MDSNLDVGVQSAGLSSIRRPNCAWDLADLERIPRNGIKVFSTFACGGGSTMGYKLAGCDVIGANDIDPEMAWHYKTNLKPRLYYLCPIRDLLTKELPEEMFSLDILDGSPPCSTFSMAGSREEAWGKKKHFREGQSEQVLSDLFFDFLDLAGRLKPKAIIAENVKGMLVGNAKGYCKQIMQRFRELGYRPQLFLVNAADCGVPQTRERVFFCAVRNTVSMESLVVNPRHRWVSVAEATSALLEDKRIVDIECRASPKVRRLWEISERGERLDKANMTIAGKKSWFTWSRLHPSRPSRTLMGTDSILHWDECRHLSFAEQKRIGSFPDDYVTRSAAIGKYMIGMSVPPFMMREVAKAVCSQWLGASYG